jgi:precorrin-6B methylase 2
MLQVLLEEDGFRACRSLRRVICGGEPLPSQLRDRFFEFFNAELHNIYGPTEATIGATYWTCLPGQTSSTVPIGRPIANTRVYLVDRWMNPVPIGVKGELCIAGDGVALGYRNRPELTQERFKDDLFSSKPGARLYRTGDLARYLPDGNIEYLGRIDQQVKVRGHRVEPAEVERALARHRLVQDCVVLPVEDEAGHRKIAAWVVSVPDEPELWPSLGEYDVYDELLYYAMTHDERRNRAYQAAIRRSVKGQVVLDIGTGADAILSRFCVEAGAERVYAIEQREDAWQRATDLVKSLGLKDRINVIHGESTNLQLPEKVDVCVSEILGTIGSSEGVIPVLNDARRFLKDGGIMIPLRCLTQFAAVSLPEKLGGSLGLAELPRVYVERVFAKHGNPFDLRMCVKNFPQAQVLSNAQTFEDLDFNGFVNPACEAEATCTIQKDGRLDGFLLWLNLCVGQEEWIDSLHHRVSWLPVFFPVFYPGVEVSAGDLIHTSCLRRLGDSDRMPDYEISGVLVRKDVEPVHFSYRSPHRSAGFREDRFYGSLFSAWHTNGAAGHGQPHGDGTALGLVPTLRRYLQKQLPEYMVPSSFVVLGELPRTPSGKVDQRALPTPGHPEDREGTWAPPHTEVERIIVDIWRDVLDVEEVGIHHNFFDLGGDSLLISSVRSRLERLLKVQVSIVDLFRYPTVHSLARFVEEGEAKTDLFEKVQDRARMQLDAAVRAERRMGISGNE